MRSRGGLFSVYRLVVVVLVGLTRESRAALGLAFLGFVELAGATPWTDSTED